MLFFTFGRCFLNIWVSGGAIAFELVGFSFVELISFSSLFTIGLICTSCCGLTAFIFSPSLLIYMTLMIMPFPPLFFGAV